MECKNAGNTSTEPHRLPTILALDEDDDNLRVLTGAIESFGFVALGVPDANLLVPLAQACQPDAIAMEVVLHHADGLDMVRALKCSPSTRHIPVIAVTGMALPGDRLTVATAGCCDRVAKPFMFGELYDTLLRHMGFVPLSAAPRLLAQRDGG